MTGLRVLVVDDERPALDELAYLLGLDDRVSEVLASGSATDGLRLLHENDVDAVFLDIQMPGLTGLELAQVLRRFASPPPIVFVTAHEEHAVEAFELRAVDYVLKPVRAERLAEAVRRVIDTARTSTRGSLGPSGPVGSPGSAGDSAGSTPGGHGESRSDAAIPVELGGVTRFVDRGEITHVEAQGDYARLHTPDGTHLIRVPLSSLETEWADAGFLRIHRSLLVALGHVREVRMESGRCSVVVGRPGGPTSPLQVSRRHTRALRERLGRGTGA